MKTYSIAAALLFLIGSLARASAPANVPPLSRVRSENMVECLWVRSGEIIDLADTYQIERHQKLIGQLDQMLRPEQRHLLALADKLRTQAGSLPVDPAELAQWAAFAQSQGATRAELERNGALNIYNVSEFICTKGDRLLESLARQIGLDKRQFPPLMEDVPDQAYFHLTPNQRAVLQFDEKTDELSFAVWPEFSDLFAELGHRAKTDKDGSKLPKMEKEESAKFWISSLPLLIYPKRIEASLLFGNSIELDLLFKDLEAVHKRRPSAVARQDCPSQ